MNERIEELLRHHRARELAQNVVDLEAEVERLRDEKPRKERKS